MYNIICGKSNRIDIEEGERELEREKARKGEREGGREGGRERES